MQQARIWIFEDYPSHHFLLETELAPGGHTLTIRDNVLGALALIKNFSEGKTEQPDVVVLDGDLGTSHDGGDARTIYQAMECAGVNALIIGYSTHDMRDILRPDFPSCLNTFKLASKVADIIISHERADTPQNL